MHSPTTPSKVPEPGPVLPSFPAARALLWDHTASGETIHLSSHVREKCVTLSDKECDKCVTFLTPSVTNV
jgi:hypothetical protein